MKPLSSLFVLAAFVTLPVWAQSTSTQPPKFAPVPPPPGMNDPGVKPTAPPSHPASPATSAGTPAEVNATPIPGKPIPLPATAGEPSTATDARSEAAPDVTVHTEGDAIYQEYRRGGRVYMVVVTQKNGISYTYMVDPNGVMRATEGAPPVRPVMYKVLEWGKSRPAEAASSEAAQGDSGH